jgi:hypothetical protein
MVLKLLEEAAELRRTIAAQRDEIGDLGLQLRLDLARMFIRQRAMSAGIGVDHTPTGDNRMAKTAKKQAKRREWTKDDLRELKAYSRSKTPVPKISKLTKRTVGALRQKALLLGISLGHRRQK